MHILLVEDSEVHSELVRDALLAWEPGLIVSTVRSVEEARAFLAETLPHLVLLDYKLPDGLGTDLLRQVDRDLCPFIVLTGSGDEQAATEAMRSGALDYLVKSPETIAALPLSVARTLREWDHICRRREAEAALRANEAKYRNLFDNMSDAVAIDQLVRDADGEAVDWEVIEVNPAYEKVYGIRQQEALGRRASELYSGRFECHPILGAAAEAMATGQPREAEFYFSGSSKYLLVSIFPLGGDRFATLGRDITERRRVEEALRESEERLRLALDAGGMGVWEWDLSRDELRWDKGQRELFGLPADRETPSPEEIWQMFHPEDRERASAVTEHALQTGELREEIRILRSDGEMAWISSSGKVLRDEEGNPVRMLGVNFDITRRKRDELERERLVAELNATINAIADAVIIYGPDGTIRHMNPAAKEKFSYSEANRDSSLGERLAGYRFETPEGEPFPVQQVMQQVAAGETMEGVLVVMRRPDGREVWLSNSAAPIFNADGKRVGAVGTSTDITELHRLQEERDRYFHTISHDLRLPLTVIRGYSQLLEETFSRESRSDQVPVMLGELSTGVRKMTRMIDDLVEMARLEGGKIAMQPACLKIGLLVEGLRQRVVDGFDWAQLRVEIPAELPPVEADPDHFERILMNLLTNARKYSQPDAPIRLTAVPAETDVILSVTDRGEGIAPDDQPHIFERFYRTSRASRRDSVGLGLYITSKLVEANRGRIWVESEPGRGSTFSFTLPRA